MTKIPSHGPLPVSVPGAVDGWFELHSKFGSKPMTELLAPAINYAEKGFPLTELIAWYLNRTVPFFNPKGFLIYEKPISIKTVENYLKKERSSKPILSEYLSYHR